MVEINKIQKALRDELSVAVQTILLNKGVDSRSEMSRSVEVGYINNTFQIIANDYMTFVDTGRKAGGRKVPVDELIPWMKKKGIRPRGKQTYSALAFAIQQAIYRTGIKGKHYSQDIINTTQSMIAESIIEEITTQVVDEIVNNIELINSK